MMIRSREIIVGLRLFVIDRRICVDSQSIIGFIVDRCRSVRAGALDVSNSVNWYAGL